MQARGRRKKTAEGAPSTPPPDKAQRNFTDGDSRIQPTRDGYITGFNGQIAVDAAHQIILAQRLATNPADYGALIPLVDQANANLGRKLKRVSGDTPFATPANITDLPKRTMRAHLTPEHTKQ